MANLKRGQDIFTVEHLGDLLNDVPNTAAVILDPSKFLDFKHLCEMQYSSTTSMFVDSFIIFVASKELQGTVLAARSVEEFVAGKWYAIPMRPSGPAPACWDCLQRVPRVGPSAAARGQVAKLGMNLSRIHGLAGVAASLQRVLGPEPYSEASRVVTPSSSLTRKPDIRRPPAKWELRALQGEGACPVYRPEDQEMQVVHSTTPVSSCQLIGLTALTAGPDDDGVDLPSLLRAVAAAASPAGSSTAAQLTPQQPATCTSLGAGCPGPMRDDLHHETPCYDAVKKMMSPWEEGGSYVEQLAAAQRLPKTAAGFPTLCHGPLRLTKQQEQELACVPRCDTARREQHWPTYRAYILAERHPVPVAPPLAL